MIVRYRNKVKEYSEKIPTLQAILEEFGLNPLAVLVLDRKTGTLLPPGRPLEADMDLEIRAVISGG